MTRRGLFLFECMVTFCIALLLLDIGFTLVHAMSGTYRERTEPPAELVDLCCDHMRLDAMHGLRLENGGLLAGGHRWQIQGGMLTRDRHPLIHVVHASWSPASWPHHRPSAAGADARPDAGALAMTRSGFFGSAAAMLLLTLVLCLATLWSGWASQRQLALAHRQHRLQGREWCLGAESLDPGEQVMVGHWRIGRSKDGSVSAVGPAGTYSIDSHGVESWRTGPGGWK